MRRNVRLFTLICVIIDRRKKPRGCAAHIICFTHRSLSQRLLVNLTISSRTNSTTMKRLLIIYLLYTLFQAALLVSPCVKITYRQTKNAGFRCTQLTTLQQHLDKAWTNTTIITIFDSNIPNIPG